MENPLIIYLLKKYISREKETYCHATYFSGLLFSECFYSRKNTHHKQQQASKKEGVNEPHACIVDSESECLKILQQEL